MLLQSQLLLLLLTISRIYGMQTEKIALVSSIMKTVLKKRVTALTRQMPSATYLSTIHIYVNICVCI